MRAAVAGLLVTLAAAAPARILDSLVARVDREVITWSEVLQEGEIRRLAGEPASVVSPRVVREALVRRELLRSEAEKLRIEVDPEEVEAAVVDLVRAVGPVLWARLEELGLERDDLVDRERRLLRVRRYLELRREMTFVPEAEIRAFYAEQRDVLGSRSLADVRADVRDFLVERKFQKELKEWIDRQVAEGRVTLIPLPEEP